MQRMVLCQKADCSWHRDFSSIRRISQRSFLIFILVFPVLRCGPGTIRKLDIVGLRDVTVKTVTQEAITLDVGLDIRNERSLNARVSNLSFEMGLVGDYLGTGRSNESIDLHANSINPVRVPVVVECALVSQEDFFTLFKSEIPYRIRGSAVLEKPWKAPDVKLDVRGSLKNKESIQVLLEEKSSAALMRVKGTRGGLISLLRNRGSLNLEITNPFEFPVPVDRIKYEVESGGQVLGDGALLDQITLVPGTNEVGIPVRAHPLAALAGVLESLLSLRKPAIYISGTLYTLHNERELRIDFRYLFPE